MVLPSLVHMRSAKRCSSPCRSAVKVEGQGALGCTPLRFFAALNPLLLQDLVPAARTSIETAQQIAQSHLQVLA